LGLLAAKGGLRTKLAFLLAQVERRWQNEVIEHFEIPLGIRKAMLECPEVHMAVVCPTVVFGSLQSQGIDHKELVMVLLVAILDPQRELWRVGLAGHSPEVLVLGRNLELTEFHGPVTRD
jgi:hypothetical protein